MENGHQRWVRFLFSMIGLLLSAPPATSKLKQALLELA